MAVLHQLDVDRYKGTNFIIDSCVAAVVASSLPDSGSSGSTPGGRSGSTSVGGVDAEHVSKCNEASLERGNVLPRQGFKNSRCAWESGGLRSLLLSKAQECVIGESREAAVALPVSSFSSWDGCPIKAGGSSSQAPRDTAGRQPYGTASLHPSVESRRKAGFLVGAGPVSIEVQVS